MSKLSVYSREQKCREVEKLKGDIAKIRKALKRTIKQAEHSQKQVAHLEKIIDAVHYESTTLLAGAPAAQVQLLGVLRRIERATELERFRASAETQTADKGSTLEKENETLRREIRKRDQRYYQLNADLASVRAKLERESEKCRAIFQRAKEAEMMREGFRRKLEMEKEKCRKADEEAASAKTMTEAAQRDVKRELTELQRNSLNISLQYERQCEVLEKLQRSRDDAHLAAEAARNKQKRETIKASRQLERLKKESAGLLNELKKNKKELKTEVLCREKYGSQLRSTRTALQTVQLQLANEEIQKRELQRKLENAQQLLALMREQRRADQELLEGLAPSGGDPEGDGVDPQQVCFRQP